MGFLKQVLRLPRETRAAGTVTTDVLYGIFSSENSYSRTGKQGNQLSAAMRLPMKYIYLCIPVGCGFMLVHAVDAVLGLLFGKEEA